jgi:hypothetical protein
MRATIVAVTRALASAGDRDQVLELLRGRAKLRQELEALELEEPGNRPHARVP